MSKLENDFSNNILTQEAELSAIKSFYQLRKDSEVTQFLEEHPFLISLLIELYDKIRYYFDSDTEMILDLVTDPEAEVDRVLFALIRTKLPSSRALDRLDRLDDEWWLENLHHAEGKLCIDVDFG